MGNLVATGLELDGGVKPTKAIVWRVEDGIRRNSKRLGRALSRTGGLFRNGSKG